MPSDMIIMRSSGLVSISDILIFLSFHFGDSTSRYDRGRTSPSRITMEDGLSISIILVHPFRTLSTTVKVA
jgi:hypothetical protein